jgi:hypothetical protein
VSQGKSIAGYNELYDDKAVDDYEKGVAMRNSKFCIIVEWDITTPHYMSEQLNQALLAGCVPVYYGSDQVNRTATHSSEKQAQPRSWRLSMMCKAPPFAHHACGRANPRSSPLHH